MTPLEIVLAAKSRLLNGIDGEKYKIKLGPPVATECLNAGPCHRGLSWPPEVAELVGVVEEIEGGPFGALSFNGPWHGLVEVFPVAMELLGDGLGNSWVVDIEPQTGLWGAVYFSCHDPPVIVFQADSLVEFLGQYFNEVDRLEWVQSRAMAIWEGDEWGVKRFLASPDLDSLVPQNTPGDWVILDLRNARVGDGFIWDPLDRIQRLGTLGGRPVFLRSPE